MRAVLLAIALVGCHAADEAPGPRGGQTIHVAVIGGMVETGFWQELAGRYEHLTGNKIEVSASGPKAVIVDAFRKGGIDLITVHASDAMINLVADGLAVDPQPWARNDLVIVGPHDDPAHIRGERDAVVAIKKIIDTKSPLIVHASLGADGVLHDLQEAGHLTLVPEVTTMFNGENQHAILDRAAEAHAYTMVGRIPFISGKLKNDGIELMVKGDPRLRRPYLVAVAPQAPAAARDLEAFMREPDTQQWITTFGKGRYDDDALFFPVTLAH